VTWHNAMQMQTITNTNFCPYNMYYYGAHLFRLALLSCITMAHNIFRLLSIVISYIVVYSAYIRFIHVLMYVYSCNYFFVFYCNHADCAVHVFNIVELEVHKSTMYVNCTCYNILKYLHSVYIIIYLIVFKCILLIFHYYIYCVVVNVSILKYKIM